jgi:DNA polymerase III epsilon subunit family exonuclease
VTSPARGGSLVERARDRLLEGPADTLDLARSVLRLSGPPSLVRTAVFSLLGSDARFRVDADGVWSLGDLAAGPALDELRYAVVDVEATGGAYLSGDRIIEIAIAQVHRGQVGELWHTLVNPGRSLPFGVQHLTGIGDTMVVDAPFFDHVAPEVLRRLSGRVFVGHNVGFDWRLVYSELNSALGSAPSLRRLCTIRMSRCLLPRLRRRNLDALSRHYGIVNHARHRADGDALATARVLVRLLDEARGRGIRDLNALDRFLGVAPSGSRRRRGGRPRGASA